MPNPTFSKETLEKIERLKARYPKENQKSALIPVLHMAQSELGGWLSTEVMDYVANILGLLPIEVYEVASFYTMFYLNPMGKVVFEVCRTGPCAIRGSEQIMQHISSKLGIKAGETTADGVFSLRGVECLASCGTAPMMQVADKYYENLDEAKVDQLIEELREAAKAGYLRV